MGAVGLRCSHWSVIYTKISKSKSSAMTGAEADLDSATPAGKESPRKPSLKEQPSYLKEVSTALNRREDLLKMKQRLSSNSIRDLDPATKPWMRRSTSVTSTTSSVESTPEKERSRNLSRDTQASDNTENSLE